MDFDDSLADDIDEMLGLADIIEPGDLCSLLFPHFIHCYQQDTGHEECWRVRAFAKRVEREHAAGAHRTPRELAVMLRAEADDLSEGAP